MRERVAKHEAVYELLRKLQVGESVVISGISQNTLQGILQYNPGRFCTRKVPGGSGYRVWRIVAAQPETGREN